MPRSRHRTRRPPRLVAEHARLKRLARELALASDRVIAEFTYGDDGKALNARLEELDALSCAAWLPAGCRDHEIDPRHVEAVRAAEERRRAERAAAKAARCRGAA